MSCLLVVFVGLNAGEFGLGENVVGSFICVWGGGVLGVDWVGGGESLLGLELSFVIGGLVDGGLCCCCCFGVGLSSKNLAVVAK